MEWGSAAWLERAFRNDAHSAVRLLCLLPKIWGKSQDSCSTCLASSLSPQVLVRTPKNQPLCADGCNYTHGCSLKQMFMCCYHYWNLLKLRNSWDGFSLPKKLWETVCSPLYCFSFCYTDSSRRLSLELRWKPHSGPFKLQSSVILMFLSASLRYR